MIEGSGSRGPKNILRIRIRIRNTALRPLHALFIKGMLPALTKPAAGGGGKSVEEALNLLGQGFLRGGLGSSFLKSAAGGSAAPSPELRVGVSQAYVAAFTWLGPAWTERHLHAALTHVLDLAGGSSRSAASHTELVYTRKVFVDPVAKCERVKKAGAGCERVKKAVVSSLGRWQVPSCIGL